MTELKRIAIDTSKAVFTLHAIDPRDQPVIRRNIRRAALIDFFAKQPPTEVVTEACGGSRHWARLLTAQGHTVKLIPPQYVKPFVKRGEKNRNDAEAICGAGGRPNMSFVPIKSKQRQADLMVLRTRELLIGQRSLLVVGATAVIHHAKPGSKTASAWLLKLLECRPRKVVAVALANKVARIAWAMMSTA